MDDAQQAQLLARRLAREKKARKEAESLLEAKSLELYNINQQLQKLANGFENQIKERTKELEIARDDALSSSRSKSAFLANMSHEIRTPMNGVIGMTTLLMDSGLTPKQKRQASVIRSSADSLLRIINDILDLSKLESGKFELQIKGFQLCELLDSIMSSMAVSAGFKDLELLCLVERGVALDLVGDAIRLRQIIINLLSNAIKFTAEGFILLKVSHLPGSGDDAVVLRFEITDTGVGISKDSQKKLFKAFNQIGHYDEKIHIQHGTGLGLSISKKLSTLMGGKIGVDSDLGRGATFWVELPFTINGPRYVDACTIGVVVLYQPRLDIRDIMRRQLEALGNQVVIVQSVTELLAAKRRIEQKNFYRLVDIEYVDEEERKVLLKHLEDHPDETSQWLFIMGINEKSSQINRLLDTINVETLIKPISQIKLLRVLVEPDVAEEVTIAEIPLRSRINALLVEDNRVNQMVAKGLLDKENIDIDIANDGLEAIEMYQKGDYDLIFMDVNMPNMGGVEATQKIKEIMRKSNLRVIPIVVLTANVMDGASERYIENGMDDFLSKPIVVSELKKVLARWFG